MIKPGFYTLLGETDRALDLLEQARLQLLPGLPYRMKDPAFVFVRDDPRFQDLLRGMNLPAKD